MGGVSSIQFFLDFWNCFNFAKPLTYLSNVFLLFFLQREFYKDLLEFLVAIVYDELLKAVHLQQGRDCVQQGRDCVEQGRDSIQQGRDSIQQGREYNAIRQYA